MRTARAAAIVTWSYVAGFGLPAPLVANYLLTHGRLPSFFGMFEMYAGPWSAQLSSRQLSLLLTAYLAVCGAVGVSGWLLWRGRRAGAILNLALLPVEAVFWVGFALPLPWLSGAARVVLVGASWQVLATGRPGGASSVTARR